MSYPTKIYKFPNNGQFPEEWVAISKEGFFDSWGFSANRDIEYIKSFQLRETSPIGSKEWQKFYKFAQRCINGEFKDFIVWRADQENQTTDPKPTASIVRCRTCKYFPRCELNNNNQCLGRYNITTPDNYTYNFEYKHWEPKENIVNNTPPNPSTFWIVWNPEYWKPPSFRHTYRQDAEQEAERLASAHPGQEFFVCEIKSKFVAAEVTKTEFAEPVVGDNIPF